MANEKRLIELETLIDSIDWDNDLQKWTLRGDPEDIDTVDAVEVVHSQWDTVFYERNGTLASYSHICPNCKYFYRDVKFKGHNYCPNCGADMRGDGNA